MPIAACSMAAGALSGALIFPSFNIIIASSAVSAVALGLVVLSVWLRFKAAIAFLIACAFSMGFSLAGSAVWRASSISVPLGSGHLYKCEAVVEEEPVRRPWGVRVDVRLRSCRAGRYADFEPARGGVRLSARYGGQNLAPGDLIRFSAKFKRPRQYKNPGSFSYRRYLMAHGISAAASVWGRVKTVASDGGNPFGRLVRYARKRIRCSMDGVLAGDERAVVAALAIGDRDGITPALRDEFSFAGVSHVLAISGLHVGYIALAVYFLSRLLFGLFPALLVRVPLPRLAALVTIPAIWLYVAITGFSVSAMRAALMLTVFLAGVLVSRRQDLITTLAVAVVAVLIVMPLAVFDVSFQLSVVAVLGIILMVPPMVRRIQRFFDRAKRLHKIAIWILTLVAVSIAATLSTWPLVAYHFEIVTSLGLITNVLAVPLAGFALVPSVAAASALAFVSPVAAAPVWKLSGFMSSLLIGVASAGASLGGPLVIRWAPTTFEVVLAYAALAAVVFWRTLPYKKALVASLAALVVFDAGYWHLYPMIDKKLEITFLDVWQGDSALVRFPSGETILVDAGGIKGAGFDIGRNVVAPALWRMGIHRIDRAVLTHPHHDHYIGLGYIAEQFGPKLIWTNGLDAPPDEMDDWHEFLARTHGSKVPLVAVGDEGIEEEIGGTLFRLIRLPFDEGDDLNDTSLVVDIVYGSHRILLLGDLAQAGERMLMAKGLDLSADVVKIGHHGTKDAAAQELLDAARPRIAIISVGEGNEYGVPHKEVIDRLDRVGARLYRTDRDGAITIRSDGRRLKVTTSVGK